MSAQRSPSIGRVYGIARVSRLWRVARATVYRASGASAPPSGACCA